MNLLTTLLVCALALLGVWKFARFVVRFMPRDINRPDVDDDDDELQTQVDRNGPR